MSIPHIINNQLSPLPEELRASLAQQIEDAVGPLRQALQERESVLSGLYDAKEAELGMKGWQGAPFHHAQQSMSFYIRGDILQIQASVADGNLAAATLLSKTFAENTAHILAKVDAFIEKARNATSVEELEEEAELN